MLLQINLASDTTQLVTAETAAEIKFSLLELSMKGGWIMIPIILLSFITIYIFFERYFAIKKETYKDSNFMNMLKDYIHDGKIDAALSLCKGSNTIVSKMIEKGISRLGNPLNDINTAIENIGKQEISKLEKGLPTIATVSGGAPMIGFLGTVMGMIRAFYNMSNAGSNIDITLLSEGIYQAMVTTVAGLVVGIIAYFAYNYLVARIDKIVNNLESQMTEFMDLLNEPAK